MAEEEKREYTRSKDTSLPAIKQQVTQINQISFRSADLIEMQERILEMQQSQIDKLLQCPLPSSNIREKSHRIRSGQYLLRKKEFYEDQLEKLQLNQSLDEMPEDLAEDEQYSGYENLQKPLQEEEVEVRARFSGCLSPVELISHAQEERHLGYFRRARIIYQMIIEQFSGVEQHKKYVSEAHISAGFLFAHTYDKDHDPQKAIDHFNRADKLGDNRAPFQLGHLYEQGIGFKKDKQKALEYFKRSADMNYNLARVALQNLTEEQE